MFSLLKNWGRKGNYMIKRNLNENWKMRRTDQDKWLTEIPEYLIKCKPVAWDENLKTGQLQSLTRTQKWNSDGSLKAIMNLGIS